MSYFADRIEKILKEFREHYSEQMIESIAFRAIRRVQTVLELDRKPTLEEFKFAFTKEVLVQVIHEGAFYAMADIENYSSTWSGGHSVTNMLEQEKRKIITKTFSCHRIDDKLENSIEMKVKEILEQGESK